MGQVGTKDDEVPGLARGHVIADVHSSLAARQECQFDLGVVVPPGPLVL